MKTGLDRLLEEPARLSGRSYGLLSHGAAVDRALEPAHLALVRSGAEPPRKLFGPEHGFYGVEQDMVASVDEVDPWTGVASVSLYGDGEDSLTPEPAALEDLDLLVIDLQDVGARYYTYAATAIWAAEAALAVGSDVWVLDRPNPLGGEVIEGNLRKAGFESFVGAFELPARHGLTLGELMALEARRRGWSDSWQVLAMEGWRREHLWPDTGRPWVPPSPNLPRFASAMLYPGLCLVEATQLSEGRGTTRPFQLVGAPGVDPVALADRLNEQQHPGVAVSPTYFKPQYQKHAGSSCGGILLEVIEPRAVASYELGVELIAALRRQPGAIFAWRDQPYEFVTDRPAIDLLTGTDEFRRALDEGGDFRQWIDGWEDDEQRFRRECAPVLLYD